MAYHVLAAPMISLTDNLFEWHISCIISGMKKSLYITFILLMTIMVSKAQYPDGTIVFAKVNQGDTIPVVTLKEVCVNATMVFKNKRHAKKYNKLVRNVLKVYPYAKIAGNKFREYEEALIGLSDRKEQRQMMKQAEMQLRHILLVTGLKLYQLKCTQVVSKLPQVIIIPQQNHLKQN